MPTILSKKIHILHSPATEQTKEKIKDTIFLIYQFFVHKNPNRHRELQMALRFNVANPLIAKIYLLNERIYTEKELGIASSKIKQMVLGKRLTFKNVFDFIHGDNLQGYCITCNADIFLDRTLENIYTSGLDKNKNIYAQLRFDCIPGKALGHSAIFRSQLKEPRADSQDTWIFHSNFNISKKNRKLFSFPFGKRGCDNKLTYLFYLLGYKILNQPYYIKTYHIHNTAIRGYDIHSEMLHGPYLQVGPYISGKTLSLKSYPAPFSGKQKMRFDLKCYWNNKGDFAQITYGNERMCAFLEDKLKSDTPWNIFLLNPIILKLLRAGLVLQAEENEMRNKMIVHEINKLIPLLKREEGILLNNNKDYQDFCIANFAAMENSDLCIGYTHLDHMYAFMGNDHDDIYKILKQKKVPFISRDGLDIYQYIHRNPWTQMLRGKRILIVAPFIEKISERVKKREIYDFDFFPECEFVFVQSPRTYGENETKPFQQEAEQLAHKILTMRETFDVALLACNGYSAMMSHYIKRIGKSAITVGNFLYLWFGVYTKNDLKYRSDIIKLNMNKEWCPSELPGIFEHSL